MQAATQARASWAETATLVADQLRLRLPSPDILTAEQRYGDPSGYRCHLMHAIYGTDISRLGSSVRRVYDLPVVAGTSG